MKTFLKIWPVVYAAVGHPWMLGFFCMVMTLLQPTDSFKRSFDEINRLLVKMDWSDL